MPPNSLKSAWWRYDAILSITKRIHLPTWIAITFWRHQKGIFESFYGHFGHSTIFFVMLFAQKNIVTRGAILQRYAYREKNNGQYFGVYFGMLGSLCLVLTTPQDMRDQIQARKWSHSYLTCRYRTFRRSRNTSSDHPYSHLARYIPLGSFEMANNRALVKNWTG